MAREEKAERERAAAAAEKERKRKATSDRRSKKAKIEAKPDLSTKEEDVDAVAAVSGDDDHGGAGGDGGAGDQPSAGAGANESAEAAAAVAAAARRRRARCTEVVRRLLAFDKGQEYPIFQEPVDPVAMDLPDYFDIIKDPMDLGTVQAKLERGEYDEEESVKKEEGGEGEGEGGGGSGGLKLDALKRDVYLTLDNSITFNGEDTWVADFAEELRGRFDAMWAVVLADGGETA